MAFPFRGLWGWLRGRWAFARHSNVQWMRPEHAEERLTALRCGLQVKVEPIEATTCWYLRVVVPTDNEVGAIKLAGADQTYYAIIHQSTKRPGAWQTSYFCELLHDREENHPTLQEALDSARDGGMTLQSVMTLNGKQLA